MVELRDDLRFAARLLRKSPGFTAVAVLSLALAIGANTAIFSVVNGVLLRPLPFLEPDRLFQVVRHDPGRDDAPLSVPQYAFLLRQEQPFSRLAAWPVIDSGFNLSGEIPPQRIRGARVTPSFFEVLGVSPVLGRGFRAGDDAEGGPRVVVVAHELWQRRLGGRPDAIGGTLNLDGEDFTIIGVAPPGFAYPRSAQVWLPLRLDPASTEDTHYLMVVGRLKPESRPEQAAAQVKAQGEQLGASRPGAVRPGDWLDAGDLQSVKVHQVRTPLLVLLGAVGLVLLVACVNLASLQLARGMGRERELSVRIALGANAARIFRQFLTESVLLSVSGGAVGLLLATWFLPSMLALAPEGLLAPEEAAMGGRVIAFTLGISVLAGLLFGLLPAWQASRMSPGGSLRVSALSATSSPPRGRTQWVLVVGQVTLAVILLIGASLLAKSFVLLRSIAPGFDSREVWTAKLSLPESRYGTPEALESFAHRVTERLKGQPSIQAAGFALTLPLESGLRLDFIIQGRREGEGAPGKMARAHYRPVTHGYFDALKIERVRGRLLDDLDRSASAPVAVINEAAARRFWPDGEPLGQHITLGSSIPQIVDPEPREIIGVVSDVRELALGEEPQPVVYIPLGQMPAPLLERFASMLPQSLLVRASGDRQALAETLRREIWAVDPTQPVTDVTSMEQVISRSVGPQRFNTLLLGLMALLALALAAVGLYGVLSYRVNQRAREMGVRLALGAPRSAVVWLVLRRGLSAVLVGVALGVAAAFKLTPLLEHELYSVSAWDPWVFVSAPAALVAVTLVSTWLPAFRASRVDPMVTLRSE